MKANVGSIVKSSGQNETSLTETAIEIVEMEIMICLHAFRMVNNAYNIMYCVMCICM